MTNKGIHTAEHLGYLQTIPAELLADAASGRVDLNALARIELRNRGLDDNGQWAGFNH